MMRLSFSNTRKYLSAMCVAATLAMSTATAIAQTSGELYFTRYSGDPNVGKVQFNYDGTNFTVSNINLFAKTQGADGIVGNPQAPGELLIGAQGYNAINRLNPATGEITVYPAPARAQHLVVTDSKTVFATDLPGELLKFNVTKQGELTDAVIVPLTGDDTELTTLLPTPYGYFYVTDEHASGNGSFGRVDFNNDLTAGETTRLANNLHAAHAGTYDPYTDTIMIFGGRFIYQMDTEGNIISELDVPMPKGSQSPVHFDQGTVDGKGHIFVADNIGYLIFVDVTQTKLVGDSETYVGAQYITEWLDDVAPLIGYGSTDVEPDRTGCNNGFGNSVDCEPYGHIDNDTAAHQEQDDYLTGAWVDDSTDEFKPTNYFPWWAVHTHNSWGVFGSSKKCPNAADLGQYSSGAYFQFRNMLRDRNTLKSACMQKGAAAKWGSQFNVWYGQVRLEADRIDHIIYHAPHANGKVGDGASLGWTIVDASNQTVIASGHFDYTNGNPHKKMLIPAGIETPNGIDIWMGFVGHVGAEVFHDTKHNKNQTWFEWLAEYSTNKGEVVGATGKNVIGVSEFTFMQRIK